MNRFDKAVINISCNKPLAKRKKQLAIELINLLDLSDFKNLTKDDIMLIVQTICNLQNRK